MIDLITGYKGQAHITAAEDAKFNAAMLGEGNYVFMVGNKLASQIVSNNCVRILDGLAAFQGRKFYVEDYEDVIIDTGAADKHRTDLIVARYEKSTITGVESITFAAIKGVESDTETADPEYTVGNMNDGDLLVEIPVYRVKLSGLDITAVEKMDNWEEILPMTERNAGGGGNYTYGTTDLIAGVSELAEGSLYFMYE